MITPKTIWYRGAVPVALFRQSLIKANPGSDRCRAPVRRPRLHHGLLTLCPAPTDPVGQSWPEARAAQRKGPLSPGRNWGMVCFIIYKSTVTSRLHYRLLTLCPLISVPNLVMLASRSCSRSRSHSRSRSRSCSLSLSLSLSLARALSLSVPPSLPPSLPFSLLSLSPSLSLSGTMRHWLVRFPPPPHRAHHDTATHTEDATTTHHVHLCALPLPLLSVAAEDSWTNGSGPCRYSISKETLAFLLKVCTR